ncbi:hypothetical protein [Kineococcus sp. SYSU DK018]|uniref:hypothetical protein n=1 Tax=Kineococcus sp. SYSU DK018 TaxID=3383139 RepID=UPI003D7D3A5B
MLQVQQAPDVRQLVERCRPALSSQELLREWLASPVRTGNLLDAGSDGFGSRVGRRAS